MATKQQSFLNFPTNTLSAAPDAPAAVVPPPSPSIRPAAPMSVSEQTRIAKEALKQEAIADILMGQGGLVPVTGNYYDAIRATQQVRTSAPSSLTNQFVRGIYSTRGGVKSFAAANYNYPSQQMVVGAALAGFGEAPTEVEKLGSLRLGRLVGDTYVAPFPVIKLPPTTSSPSEVRRQQMAGLLGLAGVAKPLDKRNIFLVVSPFVNTTPVLKAARDAIREGVRVLNDKFGAEISFDFNKLWASLADYMHQTEIDVLQALANSLGGSLGSLGYTTAKSYLPETVKKLVIFTNPDDLRRNWAAQLYKQVWDKDPNAVVLARLLADDNYALATDFESAVKTVASKQYDPDAVSSATGGGTTGGTTGGAKVYTNKDDKKPGITPGMTVRPIIPTPKYIIPSKNVIPVPQVVPQVQPAAEKSNTGLIVGGVAAVALVAFIALRKK